MAQVPILKIGKLKSEPPFVRKMWDYIKAKGCVVEQCPLLNDVKKEKPGCNECRRRLQ